MLNSISWTRHAGHVGTGVVLAVVQQSREMKLAPGVKIGPFEVVAPLGAGGMGEVYRARDSRLQRDVAIKILTQASCDRPDASVRFEREARAVAALSHSNILAIYDIGTHEGISYVVTELLEGETLRSRLSRSTLQWRQAVEIGIQIAAGVAAAHEQNIIHRDLKPENLFLTSDGQVKILDFGLASMDSPPMMGLSERTTVTCPGTVLGTVGYMSPEQVQGKKADQRSDIFSLGCVLFEMVVGRRAFFGRTPIQTLNAILEIDPPPASKCERLIPPALDLLIAQCLNKDPNSRKQSAFEIKETLQGLATTDQASNLMSRPQLHKRLITVASLSGLVMLMVVAGVLFRGVLWPIAVPRPIRNLAVLPLQGVPDESRHNYFANGITDALIAELGRLDDVRVIARTAVDKYSGGDLSFAEVARDLNVQAIITGSVRRSNDEVSVTLELVDPATEAVTWSRNFQSNITDILRLQSDLAIAVADEIAVAPSPRRTDPNRKVDPQAYESYLRALYLLSSDSSDESNEKSIELLLQSIGEDPGFAPARATLAIAYIQRRAHIAPQEAGTLDSKAFAALEQALLLDSNLAEAYIARGDLLWTASHRFAHERSAQEYRRALKNNPSLDRAHEGLARIFSHVGFLEEAIWHSTMALECNPGNGVAMHHWSEALLWLDKDQEALAVLKKIPQSIHPELVAAHTAWALARLGREEEAMSALSQSRSQFSDDPNGVLSALEALFLADSQPDRAKQLIQQAKTKGGFNPSHHTAYFIGCAYAKMGMAPEALRHLQEAADNGFPCYPLLTRDPNLDSLREDAEFRSFLDFQQAQFKSLSSALFETQRINGN